jgi:hypothetical protein
MNIDELKQKYIEDYNKYRSIMIERVENYSYKYNNKEDFIYYCSIKFLLTYKTNLKFLEIDSILKEKINNSFFIDNSLLYKDLIQYKYKECCVLRFNTEEKYLKTKIEGSYEELEERMFYRIELYKEGWNVEQIEKYIYKYVLKEDYKGINNIRKYENLYYNLSIAINLNRMEYTKSVGRPKLPTSIRMYINQKLKERMRDHMRTKYKILNKYEKIKNNLLTLEEFNELKSKIKDKNVLDKISNFVIQ